MNIKEVMSSGAETCAPDTKVADLARRMRDEGFGSIAVAEDEKLIGMVTDRDIVLRGVAEDSACEGMTARDVMSERVLYCFDDDATDKVLESMGKNQVRRMPVVNRDKRLVGVVSLGDLARHVPAEECGEALKKISSTAPSSP